MTPPLCPACGRRASQRANYFPSMGRGGFIECRSPFHDAGDWGPTLLEAIRKHKAATKGAPSDVDGELYAIIAVAEGRKEDARDEGK